MKKVMLVVLFALCSWAVSAQKTAKKVTVASEIKGCMVALINTADVGDKEKNEFGWWSAWQKIKQAKTYKTAPAAFANVPHGKYIIVVYNPKADLNGANPSDGVVLQEIEIGKKGQALDFKVKKADFKEWNCLSCPWLYVWDGANFVKETEVIKDVVGKANEQTSFANLKPTCLVNRQVKIRIQEEKDEISYLNRIALKVGEQVYFPDNLAEALSEKDDRYHTLKKGDSIELSFTLPANLPKNAPITLETTGYYEPDTKFLAEIYQKYLKTK